MKTKVFLLGILFTLVLLSSCTMERKLAIQFVQQEAKGYPVMIVSS
jgi:hypothetical protein